MTDESLELLELNDTTITLRLTGYPIPYANAIRRLALSDVPTMAIDFVYFHDNESSVYDEIIAHRLGLIVLHSDEALKKYGSPEECRDANEGDEHCYVKVYLYYEVPNDAAEGVYVKASDLKFSDPDVKPAYPDTPIIYLAPGQRIQAVAYARLGRGYEHGKWSPASISALRYSTLVEYNGANVSPACLECVSAYPEVVQALNSGSSGKMELSYKRNSSALRYCEQTACKGAVKVIYDPSSLYLTIESTGALHPARIVHQATKCLDSKVEKLLKAVEGAQVEEASGS